MGFLIVSLNVITTFKYETISSKELDLMVNDKHYGRMVSAIHDLVDSGQVQSETTVSIEAVPIPFLTTSTSAGRKMAASLYSRAGYLRGFAQE